MKNKSVMISIIGVLTLISLSILINVNTNTTINETTLFSQTGKNVKPVHKQAAAITKSECNPRMWKQWKDYGFIKTENTIGIAPTMISQNNNKTTVEVDLFIDDKLTNPDKIAHTAWHECAHAKTYTIDSDKVEQIHKDAKIAFSDCEYYFDECVADAMTQVKLPSTEYSYYQSDFTKEQLAIAEQIWNSSGTAQHKTKIKTNELTWIIIDSK